MVFILTEPAYSGSIWCRRLQKSLKERLKQKRIPFVEAADCIERFGDGYFVIASDYAWIKSTVKTLNSVGIKPILLCNQAEPIKGCDYSCVCSDVNGSVKYLLNELKLAEKTRIALYGVNTSSVSDLSRVDGLFAYKDDCFDKMRVFTNCGSLKNCFEEFFKERGSFDAVICANDFAAVSLVRNLAARDAKVLDRLKILSCAETELSHFYKKRISSLNMNFEQYGKAAVFIYEKLKTHAYMSGMTVTVQWNCEDKDKEKEKEKEREREKEKEKGRPVADAETDADTDTAAKAKAEAQNKGKNEKIRKDQSAQLPEPLCLACDPAGVAFYADDEMHAMLTIEQVLNTCIDTDRKILTDFLNGLSVEETAERCFLTEGGVKYRIKRILSECGVSDRAALIKLLGEFLPSDFEKL